MCILLERTYRCWENNAWTQHPYTYLNRCANPRYAECIAPGALGGVRETYGVQCPSCTNEFFQTRHSPVQVATNLHTIDESGPRAQAAAREYAKSLMEFLTMAYTSAGRPIVDNGDDQRAFRVCKMETACRFDKDHFDNGAYCEGSHCEDPRQKEPFADIPTNTWPELHNISAAMRRSVSHGYLFPYRGYWPCQMALYDPILVAQGRTQVVPVTYVNTERPQNEGAPDVFQTSYEDYVQRHLAQPDIQVLKNAANPAHPRDAPVAVIPFLKSRLDEKSRFQDIWRASFSSRLTNAGGAALWEAWWQASPEAAAEAELNPDGSGAVGERAMRYDFTLIATRLLSQDSGLSDARARAVADILTHIWEVSPIERGKLVGPALLGTFEKLLDAGRNLLRRWPFTFAGEMLTTEATMEFAQYYYKRNQALWLQDEHARQQAIDGTVEPLTAGEIDALAAADPDAIDCVACGEEMARPPDAHAAVRLKCGAGHTIGMSCWTRTLRRKRWVEMDGIRCHSCADKVLGPWKMPVNLDVVDAYDVARMSASNLRVPDEIQL